MENYDLELSLLTPDEKQQLEYIWNAIPDQDRMDMSKADVLLVLDLLDDYLAEKGLLEENAETGEVTYLDGEIDENDQLQWLLRATQQEGRALTAVQLQLILDGDFQYGVEQGYYEEE